MRARPHVMVGEGLWVLFHKRWREIDREWRGGLTVADAQDSPGIFESVAMCLEAARADLRAEIRTLAPHFPGSYLVPV